VDLGEVLADVRAAVAGATMAAGKRAKMLDLLDAYAAGKSYRDIQAERRISRGAISGLLHEAEELAGVRFLPAKAGTRPSVKEQIQTLTKQGREIGKRSASIYDWHCLRTTFVTHCLFGPKPMTADQVGTITGHSTAKMIHDHYSQPGADQIREKLEAALPARLAKGRGEPKQITQGGAADVAGLAAQLKTLSAADRRAVAKLLKEGGDK
jgi:integrase